MKTVLKFDRVVLIKELNDSIRKVGEVYEVANVLDNEAFLLRDSKTRVAIGVVNFSDFEEHFVLEERMKGWTKWTPLIGFDGQSDAFYKTNGKKVIVKFLTDKVRAESSCNKKEDEFNLTFGLNLAYLRARNKANEKKKAKLERELNAIKIDIAENDNVMKRMTESLM